MAELGFFGKIARFLRNVKAELKKVNWPNRSELSSNTVVVVVTVLALIAFIGVVDLILTKSITPFIM
ncbi:preprotein translocase subunit SecE [Halocella sp. SP3-1]|uniref:preprotein translocase subunit SecE n=1 Tax=Halocella sp. SP3-1 TaxID=2382161 RepID=UPI000F7510DF|nr:preprotein translocase subunit SecE [Halocella sp. SP3-1]AZO96560.1 preprotein translocase subunit SecE [Halocella sp. SP3-1]